jgi:hypothetical protein
MIALGYNEYVVQGGDWGYAVRILNLFFLLGHHLSLSTGDSHDGGHVRSEAREILAYQHACVSSNSLLRSFFLTLRTLL